MLALSIGCIMLGLHAIQTQEYIIVGKAASTSYVLGQNAVILGVGTTGLGISFLLMWFARINAISSKFQRVVKGLSSVAVVNFLACFIYVYFQTKT